MTAAEQPPSGETFMQRRLRLKAERETADRPVTSGTHAVTLDVGNHRAQRWADRKLEEVSLELTNQAPGGRNHALNAAAYALGRLTPKWLGEDVVHDRLFMAAINSGLTHTEARATIRSGLNAGMLDPRDPPIDERDGLAALVNGHVNVRPANRVSITLPQPSTASDNAEEPEHLQPFSGLDLRALNGPLPPLCWLIEGRMTRSTLTLLGSKPGVGKSWLAQSMALEVARGGAWLGHSATQGRVLYLDAENGDNVALRRLQQLGGQPEHVDDRLRYVTESMVFPTPRDGYRLRRTLDEHQPDLVIVDTLASIAPTAEAGTEEASTFLAEVWHACRDRGASMLLLCHLRKVQQGASKDDPLSSFRGAGHLVGAAHRAWVLDPIGDEKFVLRDVKTREFAAVPAVRLRLVDSGEGQDLRTDLEVEGTESQVEDGYDAYLGNVLTFIDAHPTGVAKTRDLLGLSGSETSRTLERYLDRALAAGVLKKARRGEWARAGEQLA